VDGVTWQEYGGDLECRLAELHVRIHRGAYRAQPSRRQYIPKPDGRQRPLGIAALEDSAAWHHARWLGFWSSSGPSCRCYRDIVAALPAAAFEAEWVKSQGAVVPLINETFLRLHDRYAEQPGSYELVPGDPLALLQQFATVTERYPGGETRM
jgi:hypothetical protein